ncbi:MAG TPA: hypothetical protein VIH48_04595 [Candidatus Bathyarchaeia archaeon]
MVQEKICSPACQSFKCTKNAADYRKDGFWCRWTEDMCNVANCTYAICVKRRLLPKGVCGETVKRKTVDKQPEEVISETVRLRGKALRKIGEKEIF